jgi:hypothetical protein
MKTFRVKGCPSCGEPPVISYWHGGSNSKTAVRCENDDCVMRPMVTGSNGERAANRWNTRALPIAEFTVAKVRRS